MDLQMSLAGEEVPVDRRRRTTGGAHTVASLADEDNASTALGDPTGKRHIGRIAY